MRRGSVQCGRAWGRGAYRLGHKRPPRARCHGCPVAWLKGNASAVSMLPSGKWGEPLGSAPFLGGVLLCRRSNPCIYNQLPIAIMKIGNLDFAMTMAPVIRPAVWLPMGLPASARPCPVGGAAVRPCTLPGRPLPPSPAWAKEACRHQAVASGHLPAQSPPRLQPLPFWSFPRAHWAAELRGAAYVILGHPRGGESVPQLSFLILLAQEFLYLHECLSD